MKKIEKVSDNELYELKEKRIVIWANKRVFCTTGHTYITFSYTTKM
jgi:hypothetical protein